MNQVRWRIESHLLMRYSMGMDTNEIKEAVSNEIKESVAENGRIYIPFYERFKGKQMHGQKTWKATEKEQKTIKILAVFFFIMVVLAFVSFILPIPFWAKSVLFFLAIIAGIGVMGGYMFYVIYRHHKEVPIEMRYYDVDYANNYITGKGHDNTKEISKEEFMGKRKGESS